MSTISSIYPTTSTAATSSTSSATAPTATNPLAGMTTGDFLKIMLSELQNQDPTQPTDPSALMNQMSSLESVQSQITLQQQLQGLVTQGQMAQAGGLIGKQVAGLDSNNNQISGVVTSVSVLNGVASLNLDTGQTLSMSNVTTIGPAPTATSTTTTPTAGAAVTPATATGLASIPPATTISTALPTNLLSAGI